jgi:hypothetical protein
MEDSIYLTVDVRLIGMAQDGLGESQRLLNGRLTTKSCRMQAQNIPMPNLFRGIPRFADLYDRLLADCLTASFRPSLLHW